jgi:phosphatidylinositol alpha-1,6-mannosyltransferase
MKSLLISSADFPPQTGGIARTMASLASALGPDEVCCLTAVVPSSQLLVRHRSAPFAARVEHMAGVRIYRRPSAFAKQRALQAIGFGTAIAEIMLRERPQLVQVSTAYDGYLALWLDRWFQLPFVIYAHGNEIFDALTSPWPKPRLSLARAARVLANSRFTARLLERAAVEPARIEVIHAPCDVNRFRPVTASPELQAKLLGSADRKPVILSVGRLVERKGCDMVIQALPKVIEQFPKTVYLIAGEGPYRPHLEELIRARGLRNHVIFAGRVPDDELPSIYALSDLLVMPSRERLEAGDVEGFGVVYLEANACGKPVIGGRSGGTADAVVDGVTGFLVDPLSPEEIASTISRVLSSPQLAAQIGSQGRARVLAEFTWPRFVANIRRICIQVASERSGRR